MHDWRGSLKWFMSLKVNKKSMHFTLVCNTKTLERWQVILSSTSTIAEKQQKYPVYGRNLIYKEFVCVMYLIAKKVAFWGGGIHTVLSLNTALVAWKRSEHSFLPVQQELANRQWVFRETKSKKFLMKWT